MSWARLGFGYPGVAMPYKLIQLKDPKSLVCIFGYTNGRGELWAGGRLCLCMY